jgi:hypothetical protein
MISPSHLPILRTDSDSWIWITPHPSQLEPLLLSRYLPAKTKYKLGLSLNLESLVIKTVCFFCNEGNPTVLTLPLKDPSTFDYYPDYVLNLNGKLLKMTMPAVISRLQAHKGNGSYAGVNNFKRGTWKALIEEWFMVKLNYTYNAFVSWGKASDGPGRGGGGGTGTQLKDGSWIGCVGDIFAERADIGLGVGVTPVRSKKLYYARLAMIIDTKH